MEHNRVKLEAMMEHVRYEIIELRDAMQKWGGASSSGLPSNQEVERALLHFRILRDFFLTPPRNTRYPDDVVAGHYVREWTPNAASIFAETKEDIDKRLAHLSVHRLRQKSCWRIREMNDAVEYLIERFQESLSADEKHWFELPDRPATIQNDLGNGTQTQTFVMRGLASLTDI